MTLRSQFAQAPESSVNITFIQDTPDYERAKPYHIFGPLPPDREKSRTNVRYTKLENVSLFNLRGFEHALSVHKHGFEIMQVPLDVVEMDVRSSQTQVDKYMQRMVDIVTDQLGASFALCYDYRLRSSNPEESFPNRANHPEVRYDTPSNVAHVDHTSASARKRAMRHLTPAEAET
jgi:hypothetical protein